ncbi:hypothetical protein PAPYR_10481 [Paratrimastix pyriformis]|uniref:Uncharacterized protein n=1 Tax=Paratrimastix pyriformis TaxID=342808 RepID=A0ABQ8U5T3_9EUKA|nr:hypothetical protein PAPYR_10481 [Paratrimastix pyriformis]
MRWFDFRKQGHVGTPLAKTTPAAGIEGPRSVDSGLALTQTGTHGGLTVSLLEYLFSRAPESLRMNRIFIGSMPDIFPEGEWVAGLGKPRSLVLVYHRLERGPSGPGASKRREERGTERKLQNLGVGTVGEQGSKEKFCRLRFF